MGKALSKLRKKNDVQARLKKIESRRDLVSIIHYSCESFYDIKDGRTPRITSIAVRNFATGQTASFSIHKSAEQNNTAIEDITEHYDALEKLMLDEFFSHIRMMRDHLFVHWNMRDINYGFQAIEHRYKVLNGDPEVIQDEKKFDVARGLVAMFGRQYASHGEFGRLHTLMDLNSITAKDALTGAEEALAFENAEFVRLHQSTLRKVDIIANLLDRTLDGSLRTQATWLAQHGYHGAALAEWLKDHWIVSLLLLVISVIGGMEIVSNWFSANGD